MCKPVVKKKKKTSDIQSKVMTPVWGFRTRQTYLFPTAIPFNCGDAPLSPRQETCTKAFVDQSRELA